MTCYSDVWEREFMRPHRIRLRRIHRSAIFVGALLMLGAVTATSANAALTPWGSERQVALASFNGRLYMAWMDFHANNELTIASTTNGVNWSSGTHPLGSGNTNSAPALTVFNGKLWLAWTGTDSNSTLNIAWSSNGTTFTQVNHPLGNNNSPDGPALAVFSNKLYYAWKGTDSNHTLNIASSTTGSTFTAPTQPGHYSSVNAPALAVWNSKLYMGWTGAGSINTINLASSSDGVNFTQIAFQNLAVSNFQPSMWPDVSTGALDIFFNAGSPLGFGFISFTGSSNENVQDNFMTAPDQAPTINAFGSNQVFAWLGTDPGHTINVCFGCY